MAVDDFHPFLYGARRGPSADVASTRLEVYS
jgi:hypothetical protein